MERDDTDMTVAGFFHGAIEQGTAKAVAAKLRFDVEIEEIGAGCAGVFDVRWEVDEHEAGAGDDAVLLGGEPAEVLVVLELTGDPGSEVGDDGAQGVVVGTAHVDEHAMAMVGDDFDVADGGGAGCEHASW